MGDFGYMYDKSRPTKDSGKNTENRNKFNSKQENNVIVNSSDDEILLHETQKVSAEEESHENIDSDFDENELYQIDNMSLYYKNGKVEWSKRAFECELENTYDIESQNGMTCIHDKN